MPLFVFFISLIIVAQHVSGNHVPIIRSWRLRDVIALCCYVPWLQEGCQVRLAGSASMDALLRGYNTTQSSAPDDRHMVARNMLSNYYKRNKEYKKWHLVGFSYPHWVINVYRARSSEHCHMVGQPRCVFINYIWLNQLVVFDNWLSQIYSVHCFTSDQFFIALYFFMLCSRSNYSLHCSAMMNVISKLQID